MFEFLKVDEAIADLISRREKPATIRRFAYETRLMASMREDGLGKVDSGITTIDEVDRACGDS